MRNNRSLCSLYHQLSRPRSSPSRINPTPFARLISNNPQLNPLLYTFDLTDLVLDLDDPDNPYVRRAEDIQVETPTYEVKPPPQPYKTPYSSTTADFLKLSLLFGKTNRIKFPLPLPAVRLKSRDGYRTAFEIALEQLKFDYRNVLEQLEAMKHEPERLSAKILSCANFAELKSLVSRLAASDEARRLILENDATIAEAINKIFQLEFTRSQSNDRPSFRWSRWNGTSEATPLTTREILNFVNSLSAVLSSNHLQLGPSLSETGLYYATRIHNTSAMTHYLDLVTRSKSGIGTRVAAAMHILVARKGRKRPRMTGPIPEHYTVSDVLRILTGWRTAGFPDAGEIQSPSFAKLAKGDLFLYRKYIRALGVLGATEAVAYEWKSELFNEQNVATINDMLETFIDAFLLAKDPGQALQILRSVKPKLLDRVLDHQERTQNGRRWGVDVSTRIKLLEALLYHYVLHGLPNWDGDKIWLSTRFDHHRPESILTEVKDYQKDKDLYKILLTNDSEVLQQIESLLNAS